jgi:hypothetical protein
MGKTELDICVLVVALEKLFSHVFGVLSTKSSIVILPAGSVPMWMSKKTLGRVTVAVVMIYGFPVDPWEFCFVFRWSVDLCLLRGHGEVSLVCRAQLQLQP